MGQVSPRGEDEIAYWRQVDDAIREAERIMDLEDIDTDDEDAHWQALDERHHCGVCIVRTVMETVHPAYEQLIEHLLAQKNEPSAN